MFLKDHRSHVIEAYRKNLKMFGHHYRPCRRLGELGFIIYFLSAARANGDATGVQVSRHVWLVYREDVLDEIAQFSFRGRLVERPFRWRLTGDGF